MDLLADEARLSRGVLFTSAIEFGYERLNERVMAMRDEGLNVNSVTAARSTVVVSGLSTNNFFRTPAWNELRELGPEERIQAIRNPATRQRLVDEAKAQEKEDVIDGPFTIPRMEHAFYMGDAARPCYTRDLSQNMFALAEAAGEHPVETWLRLSDETNGKALFHFRFGNRDLTTLPALLTSDWAMPGLGDAGAHISQMSDSGWTTFILSHWHRDKGVYSIQEAVRRISAKLANVLDLADCGTLAVGKRADLNVFDIDRLEESMPEMVHDFPFGAPRFIQQAVGYKATVCNGQVVLQDDELTGERPGRILRRGASS